MHAASLQANQPQPKRKECCRAHRCNHNLSISPYNNYSIPFLPGKGQLYSIRTYISINGGLTLAYFQRFHVLPSFPFPSLSQTECRSMMVLACHRRIGVVASLLLLSCNLLCEAAKSSTKPYSTSTALTCEVRTINYITDALPQLCLPSSWSSTNGSTKTAGSGNGHQAGDGTNTNSYVVNQTPSSTPSESSHGSDQPRSNGAPESSQTPEAAIDIEGGELNDASFLSFEDWKKQTLEKAGQQNPNIGNKRSGSGEGRKRDSESIQHNLDSLGEEGEIDIDFGTFRKGSDGELGPRASGPGNTQDIETTGPGRRKDAGITCKERFSYASFDAGATVLKTHPGAKNAKAVLIENKDSYMLSECAAENKFIIVELSVCSHPALGSEFC